MSGIRPVKCKQTPTPTPSTKPSTTNQLAGTPVQMHYISGTLAQPLDVLKLRSLKADTERKSVFYYAHARRFINVCSALTPDRYVYVPWSELKAEQKTLKL